MSDLIRTVFPRGHRLAGRPAWLIDGVLLPVVAGGDGPTAAVLEESPILVAARSERAKWVEKLDKLTAVPVEEKRSLTEAETADFEKLSGKVNKADKQIALLEQQRDREAKAAAASAGSTALRPGESVVRSEPLTYNDNPDGRSANGYFRDLGTIAASLVEPRDVSDALSRLRQHAKEVEIEARDNKDLARRLQEYRQTPREKLTEFELRVNPNTTAGTGGEFVPPLWLVSQYVPYVRPDRIFANRVQNLPLPPGINVINIPKITVGSTTAIQAAQAAAVSSTDIATATISANVNTIAGQEDISLQLLEQSPIAMDGVVFDDLTRDYSQRLDIQVVMGTGSGGQHLGVLSVSGNTSNTTITKSNLVNCSSTTFDGSASGGTIRSIANGVNQIETLRFMAPTAIWAHPRRTNSWAYAVDTLNRPLFIPAKYQPYNGYGLNEGQPIVQGFAGELYGLPVIKDANMTTTGNGAGTPTGGSQDAIAVLKEDDCYLWEGSLRLRALPEILSGTLQLRYQAYAYSAFMPNRFAASLSLLGGAGLAAPGF